MGAGCQAPPAPTGPTEMVLRIPDRDAFIEASLTLLRSCDLQPQRVDWTGGRIVTHRTTGAQWFEFWRIDAQGPYQTLESSLHTIGRVVTISVEPLAPQEGQSQETAGLTREMAATDTGPADLAATQTTQPQSAAGQAQVAPDQVSTQPAGGNLFRVAVRVDKYRYNAPHRQVTTASGALAIYSERIPTTEGLRKAETPGAVWVPLGRDGLLEAYLQAKLADILPDIEVVR